MSDELSNDEVSADSELSTALRELAVHHEAFPVLTGAQVRGRAVRRGRRRMAGALGVGAVAFGLVAFALTVGFTHSPDDGSGRQLPAATHADPVPSPRVTSPEVSTPVSRAPVTGTVVLGKRALIVGGRVMPMTSGLPDGLKSAGPLTIYKKHETKVVTVTDLTGGVAYTTEISLAVELRDTDGQPVYVGIAFSSKEKSTGKPDTGAGWIGLGSADAKWFYEDAKIGSALSVTDAVS